MKKLLITLVLVAAVATPAMAAVTLSGTTSGTTYTVNYAVSGPNSVRAFALDITLNSGTITSVSCSNSSYYIYPGSIQVSGSSVGYGSCVCSATQYPGKGQGGTGTAGVTVEMGSLYASGGTKPATSGTLLSFVVTSAGAIAHVSANTARGGVVMENPDEGSGSNLPFDFPAITECLKSTSAEYNSWCSFGKPNCWCFRKHCRGDADGTKAGVIRVAIGDLNLLRTGWGKSETQIRGQGNSGICGDFDHTKAGVIRVAIGDLNLLRTSWGKNDTVVKCCNTLQDCTLAAGDKWNNWTN